MTIGDFAKSFKTVWGAGVLLATAGPLGLFVPDLYPPWPENSHLIGVIFCAVAAVLSFAVGVGYAQRPRAKSKVQTAVATACLLLGLASLIGYFLAYSTRVVVETQVVGKEQRQLRFVVGIEMRADVDKTGTGDSLELLRDNQYSPEKIWTADSVRYSRVLLLVTFVAAFSMLTFGMGLLATRSGPSSRPVSRNLKLNLHSIVAIRQIDKILLVHRNPAGASGLITRYFKWLVLRGAAPMPQCCGRMSKR